MTNYIIKDEDIDDIEKQIHMIETKMKIIFPSEIKGIYSNDAMNIIKHLDEIEWLINRLEKVDE